MGAYGGVSAGWVELNRDYGSSVKNGNWKYSYPPCNQGSPPAGYECDEDPYLASTQGGGNVQPQPSLQYINGPQNGLEGTRLGQFYSSVPSATNVGIPGCNMAIGQSFLVIPVPYDNDVNTTWACNT